jgi:hypothetical protein
MENRTFRNPKTGQSLADRRSRANRRGARAFSALFAGGHRRRKSRGRRNTDAASYVDIYDSRTWSIAIAVLMLSLMDALLTGLHMIRGTARELNPIMNAFLSFGGLPAFFTAKVAMTIFPMAVIMIHKEWALGRYAAWLCLLAYVILSFYHVYLIS